MALERNGATVARTFARWGLEDAVAFLAAVPMMDGPKLAAFLEDQIKRFGLELVIVDHLQNLVKIRDSNDYSAVTLALEPFHAVAKRTDAHIALLHHQPKGRREGDTEIDCMGSEAYRASADALIELHCHDGQHYIRANVRGAADLPKTRITIDLETGKMESVEAKAAELVDAKTKILDYLAGQDEALSKLAIQDAVRVKGQLVVDALRELVEAEKVTRDGSGKKNDPFLYKCCSRSSPIGPGTESEKVPQPPRGVEQMLFPKGREQNGTESGGGNSILPEDEGEL